MKKKAAPPPPAVRWHVRAEGEVQGVGFRWTARREAASLGVSGWAENAWDGTVSLVLEGPPDALRQFLLQLSTRYPDARFTPPSPSPATGLSGFGIR
ncbi:MAG: acylphosphatase [Kiritimatiellae bacterium]|nr:acylphosphatase [Kiritimatiellia bacterium]